MIIRDPAARRRGQTRHQMGTSAGALVQERYWSQPQRPGRWSPQRSTVLRGSVLDSRSINPKSALLFWALLFELEHWR